MDSHSKGRRTFGEIDGPIPIRHGGHQRSAGQYALMMGAENSIGNALRKAQIISINNDFYLHEDILRANGSVINRFGGTVDAHGQGLNTPVLSLRKCRQQNIQAVSLNGFAAVQDGNWFAVVITGHTNHVIERN